MIIKNSNKNKYKYIILILVVIFCLLFELFSIYKLSSELKLSNRRTILDYAGQTAFRFQDKFQRINLSLKELSKDIKQDSILNISELFVRLQSYNDIWEMEFSGILLEDGEIILSDENKITFQNEIVLQDVLSYSEQLNITKQVIYGKEYLVFAKTCQKQIEDKKVTGIFAALDVDALTEMLGKYDYGEGNFMALVQSDGKNIWKQGEDYSTISANCFEDLRKMELNQSDSILQMETRMKVSMDGTLNYIKQGQEYYLAYVPLHINYWYLLVSVQSDSIDYTSMSFRYYIISGFFIAIMIVSGVFGLFYLLKRNHSIINDNVKLQHITKLANEANEAKRIFLAKISHEIRTPLNGTMGMIQLAKKEYKDQKKCIECLEKAEISAKYLFGLINDVLDMSRIESGKLNLVYEDVNLTKLVHELEVIVKNEVEQKQLELKTDTTELKHFNFTADYLRLQQILVNFISNAIKYTQEGGKILVKISEREIDSKSSVRFSVQDTGVGIAQDKIDKIFEPFEQGKVSNEERKKGVGLGLSIVKSIVEIMQGTIKVESKLGEGSIFTAEIPLEISSNNTIQIDNNESLDLTGISILLAEDNEINAEIAITLLQEQGAEIELACDGEEVLEKFSNSSQGTYQVILMDIQMPKKDGLEATRNIRDLKREDAVAIPIIAITANAFEEQKEEMFLAGMNDYLYKPIDIQKVCVCIRKWVLGGK